MDNILASTVQTQVSDALAAVAPVVGIIIAAVVGYKLFRRFTGAK